MSRQIAKVRASIGSQLRRTLLFLAVLVVLLPAAAAGQEEPAAPVGDEPAAEQPAPDSEPAEPAPDETEAPAPEPDPAPTEEEEPEPAPDEEEKEEPEPAPTEGENSEPAPDEEEKSTSCALQGAEKVSTDKSEYAAGSTVQIEGTDFAASCEANVEIGGAEDGSAPFVAEVETSPEGKLDADYAADGAGEYAVRVLGADDVELASTSFTVTAEEPAPDECAAGGAETVATDKSRYARRSTVRITGDGYSDSCDLQVEVTRPNGAVDIAEVKVAPSVEEPQTVRLASSAEADDSAAIGAFEYDYVLGNQTGRYRVRVLGADGEAFASAAFAVEGPRPTSCERRGRETIATDKADYRPGATVHMTGSGYARSCLVKVRVVRPDGSVVRGDGSFEPGVDQVRTTARGRLFYDYKLNGIEGLYRVRVLGAGNVLLAKTTFTDQLRATPSDPRATFFQGNATTCAQVGYPDDVQIGADGSDDAGDGFVEGTAAAKTLQVEITPEGTAAGVVVNAVVVKGADGYNVYEAPFVPPDEAPPQDYISPRTSGGPIPDISHWFVCYTFGGIVPDTGELLILKRVIPPRGPTVEDLPTEFTVNVTCTDGTTDTVTFGPGGGVGRTEGGAVVISGIVVGSTCTIEEVGADTFPPGSVVSYIPGQTVTIGEGEGAAVLVVNNFRNVETLTGSLRITKVVEPPSADLPDSFPVLVECSDRTVRRVSVPAGGSVTIDGIAADAYCAVHERMRLLPPDVEATYAVSDPSGFVRPRFAVVQVNANATVEVTITNEAGVSPRPPEPPNGGGGGDGGGGGAGGAAQPRGDLPLTGGPAVLFGAVGLALVAGGLALARRRNN